jgi:hypothetical protein
MKSLALVGLLGACLLLGCGGGTEQPKKGGIQINAPGVNINVDEKGGAKVNVKAPGVNVDVDGKGGANVKVPGVDIKVP